MRTYHRSHVFSRSAELEEQLRLQQLNHSTATSNTPNTPTSASTLDSAPPIGITPLQVPEAGPSSRTLDHPYFTNTTYIPEDPARHISHLVNTQLTVSETAPNWPQHSVGTAGYVPVAHPSPGLSWEVIQPDWPQTLPSPSLLHHL